MCQDGDTGTAGDGKYGYDALSEFSINENNGTYGGQTGDQTGKEAYIHGFYWYPWDLTLHYNGKADFVRKEEKEDSVAGLSDRDIARIWEYRYQTASAKDTVLQDKTGIPDEKWNSNRYNVHDAAFMYAFDAYKQAEECNSKLDRVIELLGQGKDGECVLSKLIASTD